MNANGCLCARRASEVHAAGCGVCIVGHWYVRTAASSLAAIVSESSSCSRAIVAATASDAAFAGPAAGVTVADGCSGGESGGASVSTISRNAQSSIFAQSMCSRRWLSVSAGKSCASAAQSSSSAGSEAEDEEEEEEEDDGRVAGWASIAPPHRRPGRPEPSWQAHPEPSTRSAALPSAPPGPSSWTEDHIVLMTSGRVHVQDDRRQGHPASTVDIAAIEAGGARAFSCTCCSNGCCCRRAAMMCSIGPRAAPPYLPGTYY